MYVLKQLCLRPENKKETPITILFSNWELDVIGKIEYIVALLPFYAHIHFTISVDKQWNLKQLHTRAFLQKEINKFV